MNAKIQYNVTNNHLGMQIFCKLQRGVPQVNIKGTIWG